MPHSATSTDATAGTAVVDPDRTTLVDLAGAVAALRDIGPDLHTAVLDAAHRIDALAEADAALRTELATLGIKVNALLDRPTPSAVDLRVELAAQAERIGELHELVDRLMAVALAPATPGPTDEAVRADVSLALDVLGGLVERIEALDARVAGVPTGLAGPVAAAVGDAVEARVERVAGEHLARLPAPAELSPLVDAAEALRANLARLGSDQARSGASVVRIGATVDRMQARLDDPRELMRAVRDAVRAEIADQIAAQFADLVATEVTAAVGGRTELALAGLLRLLDRRLEALASGPGPDAPSDAGIDVDGTDLLAGLSGQVSALGVAIEGVLAGQRELAGLLSGASTAANCSEGTEADRGEDALEGLEHRLAGRLDLLGDQLRVVAERVDAARAELDRRQPATGNDSLRRAAASVREALGGRRGS